MTVETIEEKVLKVPFRQTTKSGCGSHTLANLLNDERYIDGVGNRAFGEAVADLNKKLQEYKTDLYLNTVFASPSEMAMQPNKLIDPLIFKVIWDQISSDYIENYARPFFVTVKGALYHYVLILHEFSTDKYFIVDSLRENIQVVTLGQLMDKYHITTVEYLCSWNIENTADRSVFVRKDHLRHLIGE